jgi:hypothetical protein
MQEIAGTTTTAIVGNAQVTHCTCSDQTRKHVLHSFYSLFLLRMGIMSNLVKVSAMRSFRQDRHKKIHPELRVFRFPRNQSRKPGMSSWRQYNSCIGSGATPINA